MRENRPSGSMRGGKQTVIGPRAFHSVASRLLYLLAAAERFWESGWMARKARVEFEGAVYHVLDRGDRRGPIFKDDTVRRRFLETLAEVCQRTSWRVHAYVLMSNHYHFLLETPEANLVAGMRWFQTTWTMRFNTRHRLSGHLFQGRYKSARPSTFPHLSLPPPR